MYIRGSRDHWDCRHLDHWDCHHLDHWDWHRLDPTWEPLSCTNNIWDLLNCTHIIWDHHHQNCKPHLNWTHIIWDHWDSTIENKTYCCTIAALLTADRWLSPRWLADYWLSLNRLHDCWSSINDLLTTDHHQMTCWLLITTKLFNEWDWYC